MFIIYTYKDLQIMQSWSLERKVRVTQLRIMEWYKHFNGKVKVSFSGGVDSLVLLDLARRIYPEIGAVFVNTTVEYPEIVRFVKGFDNVDIITPKMNYTNVIEKYGYPVISKEVSNYIHRVKSYDGCYEAYKQGLHLKPAEWIRENFSTVPFAFWKCMLGLSHKTADTFLQTGVLPQKARYYIPKQWQHLIDAPFKISDTCCYHLKKAPVKKYLKDTGCVNIVGTLAEESKLREYVWRKNGCNAFNSATPKSTPLSFWTSQDIMRYLQITKIPYCSIYGEIEEENGVLRFTGCQRTGCTGCLFGCQNDGEPNRLQQLKITHPKIYNYLFDKLNYKEVCDYIGLAY